MQNLFTLTGYSGMDPASSAFGISGYEDIDSGIDYGAFSKSHVHLRLVLKLILIIKEKYKMKIKIILGCVLQNDANNILRQLSGWDPKGQLTSTTFFKNQSELDMAVYAVQSCK